MKLNFIIKKFENQLAHNNSFIFNLLQNQVSIECVNMCINMNIFLWFDGFSFLISFYNKISAIACSLHSFALYIYLYNVCYVQMIFMNYSLWISVTQREQRSHCIFSNSMDLLLFFVCGKNYKFVVAPCVLKMMRIIIKWTIVCV